jgi:NitT/TauT family transport system substrate-binding protein
MPKHHTLIRLALAAALGIAATTAPTRAEQIEVGNYGVSANGMPYAIAMAKAYFKDEGANVTGIITSAGGGTSLRNMLTGNVPYGEINPGLIISAIQQGAKLKIISDNVITVGEFIWAVKPDSPIKTIADFKGKKIGYTNPRSTSVALDAMLLQSAGYKATDGELVKTGGFGEGIPALDLGLIDIAPLPEPLWSQFKSKYRMVATAAQVLPPLDNVVGVTTVDATTTHAAFLKAIIRARRRAVNFMIANPDEAGDIVAKAYNLDPAVGRSAVHYLTTVKTQGLPYWGQGDFHMEGLQRMIELQKTIGAITGEVDLATIIDTQFLPNDLKPTK